MRQCADVEVDEIDRMRKAYLAILTCARVIRLDAVTILIRTSDYMMYQLLQKSSGSCRW